MPLGDKKGVNGAEKINDHGCNTLPAKTKNATSNSDSSRDMGGA